MTFDKVMEEWGADHCPERGCACIPLRELMATDIDLGGVPVFYGKYVGVVVEENGAGDPERIKGEPIPVMHQNPAQGALAGSWASIIEDWERKDRDENMRALVSIQEMDQIIRSIEGRNAGLRESLSMAMDKLAASRNPTEDYEVKMAAMVSAGDDMADFLSTICCSDNECQMCNAMLEMGHNWKMLFS